MKRMPHVWTRRGDLGFVDELLVNRMPWVWGCGEAALFASENLEELHCVDLVWWAAEMRCALTWCRWKLVEKGRGRRVFGRKLQLSVYAFQTSISGLQV